MLVIQEPYVDYALLKFTAEPKRKTDRTKNKTEYAHQIAAFDIETTRLTEIDQAFMYIWQFAIEDNIIIVGRTWEQFLHCVSSLRDRLGDLRLVCFVHNLPYEFQFMSAWLEFSNKDVFAVDLRKPVRATWSDAIEFRCSYKLTNLSLDNFTRKYSVEHAKYIKRPTKNKDGSNLTAEQKAIIKRQGVGFNYDKIRYADTPLTHKEWIYCVYDVLGLIEAIRAQMTFFDDNQYTLPLTQTGYPRRYVRENIRPYYNLVSRLYPDFRCFCLLRSAFRGGNTHGSRFYAGQILADVHTVDESSAYPFAQCTKGYPMTSFREIPDHRISYIERLIPRGAAFVMYIRFESIELINPYIPVPYISFAKCEPRRVGPRRLFNGRILSAEWAEMAITDIDYKIICKQYKFTKMEILNLWQSYYGPLPDPIIEANLHFYRNKTRLKGVDGQSVIYMNNKEQLNAIYGMSCTSPIQYDSLYNGGAWVQSTEKTDLQIYDDARRGAFQVYQWGVWTTAHARMALQRGMDIVGPDDFVYTDTDSIKYLGEHDFSAYNNECVELCKKVGAYAEDKNGIVHYMGVFEQEQDYLEFIHQGAKRYAYTKVGKDGKTHLEITVAGVPKKAGAEYLEEHGGLKAFKDQFIFADVDKLGAKYNDNNYGEYITSDGHKINITRNVCLVDTAYTMGLTDNFKDVISLSEKELTVIMQQWRNVSYKP